MTEIEQALADVCCQARNTWVGDGRGGPDIDEHYARILADFIDTWNQRSRPSPGADVVEVANAILRELNEQDVLSGYDGDLRSVPLEGEYDLLAIAQALSTLTAPKPQEGDPLPAGAIAGSDDGETVYLDAYDGGAAPQGAWGHLSLRFTHPDKPDVVRSYTADDLVKPQEAPPHDGRDWLLDEKDVQRAADMTGMKAAIIRSSVRAYFDAVHLAKPKEAQAGEDGDVKWLEGRRIDVAVHWPKTPDVLEWAAGYNARIDRLLARLGGKG